MRAPKEGDLLKACLALLALRKVPCWRNNTGAAAYGEGKGRRFVRYGIPGASDIIGLLPGAGRGRFLAVETKRKGGRVRKAQRAFLDSVRAAGGLALVVRDVRELIAALDAEGV